jgi:hypothetical protein
MTKLYGMVGSSVLVAGRTIPARPEGDPELFSDAVRIEELMKCTLSAHYFIHNYIKILDDRKRIWVPFNLYPAQINVLDAVMSNKYLILLKTRQFGASTLIGGAYFLWLMLFTQNAHNLVLSKSEREAQALMGDRFKPMYTHLPSWMRPTADSSLSDSKSEFSLSNGSKMLSLPTSAGDSYTARACMIDEAALVHRSRTNLSDVLLAVQPTIAAGGQLILVSKADKARPRSTFNSIFVEATKRENDFFPIFVSWKSVPWRTQEWYDAQKNLSMSIDGTQDFVHENYPETFHEALSPKELDKRLSIEHIDQCYQEMSGLTERELEVNQPPSLPGLEVYKLPQQGAQYVITADPAEGNPNSDPSCSDVWDWDSGEQVATLTGKVEPVIFAGYIKQLSEYYNTAPTFPERNNHGLTLIAWLRENHVRVLKGPDSTLMSSKLGYNTNVKSKAIGYVELANALRDQEITIHNQETYRQLSIIEGATLRAPKKEHDDQAISAMLFACAKKFVHLSFLLEFV